MGKTSKTEKLLRKFIENIKHKSKDLDEIQPKSLENLENPEENLEIPAMTELNFFKNAVIPQENPKILIKSSENDFLLKKTNEDSRKEIITENSNEGTLKTLFSC